MLGLLLRPERSAKYCEWWLCLFICLPVCLFVRITQKPHKFLCMLPVAVARSSSDGILIHYVLPVLWMTSRFHTMGSVGSIKQDTVFIRVRQLAVPVGRQTTSVWLSSSECGTGSQSAIYQWLVSSLLFLYIVVIFCSTKPSPFLYEQSSFDFIWFDMITSTLCTRGRFWGFSPAWATRCTNRVKFGMEESTPSLPCQISPPLVQW